MYFSVHCRTYPAQLTTRILDLAEQDRASNHVMSTHEFERKLRFVSSSLSNFCKQHEKDI